MKTTAKNVMRRRIALLLLVISAAAGIFAVLSSPRVKHALLLRFGTPQAYMAYVETNYLLSRGKEWKEEFQAISEPFYLAELTGAQLELQVNHLILDLLAEHDIAAEIDFSGIALLLLSAENEDDRLFQAGLQVNGTHLASLDFLYSGTSEELFIACPQAGSTALAFSTAQDDPLVLLSAYLAALFRAFQDSVYSAVSLDPYSYLLPYLDVIRTVELTRSANLPVPDSGLSALRLDMRLSLDAALDTAAAQLAEIKNRPETADPLLPCYETCIRLLTYLAANHPSDLLVRAYVDESGTILGHEFFLLSNEESRDHSGDEILFSLTGLLQPELTGGKSGELTLYSALSKKPLTIALSVSGLGFDAVEGGVTGKVNASCDQISSINFQLLFSTEKVSTEESSPDTAFLKEKPSETSSPNTAFTAKSSDSETPRKTNMISLPKLTLRARTLGVTLLTLTLTPTNTKPQYFPSPDQYTEIYRLARLSAFVQSLDFSNIAKDFYNRTGIRLSSLTALLRSLHDRLQ